MLIVNLAISSTLLIFIFSIASFVWFNVITMNFINLRISVILNLRNHIIPALSLYPESLRKLLK